MIRIRNFITWLLYGSAMTSGDRNLQIAAHGADLSFPNRPVYPTKPVTFDGNGGTVYNEPAADINETPEERSRRLKRERDRRYKARKKAALATGQAAFA